MMEPMFVWPLTIIGVSVLSSLQKVDPESSALAERLFGAHFGGTVLWRAGPSPLWTGVGSFWAEDADVAHRYGEPVEAVERILVSPEARVLELEQDWKIGEELERLGFDPASIDCPDMENVISWGNELYSFDEVRKVLSEHWDWVRQPIPDDRDDHEWIRITVESTVDVLERVIPQIPDRPTGHDSSYDKLLVIVDVQPTYAAAIHFDVRELVEEAVKYQAVLWLYNGEVNGLSEDELLGWIREQLDDDELFSELWSVAEFYDKGYAWIRDWMDHGVSRDDIVRVLLAMRALGVNDARELPEDIKEDLPLDPEGWALYIPELAGDLKDWDGAVVCGGGEEECLEEVRLIADAVGVQLHPWDEFVYA
jgi:hypothetical protein